MKTLDEIIKNIINWLRPKSPCHNEPMKNVDCHDNWGNTSIYECPKCKKLWV